VQGGGSLRAGLLRAILRRGSGRPRQNAPKFNDQQSCEERYGVDQCVPRNQAGGGSFFTPLLTGFIVGQALSNLGGGGYGGRALYRDRYGGLGYSDGRRYDRFGGGGGASGTSGV
jgi:uncharacterized protein YgiB involved in biofilm formation